MMDPITRNQIVHLINDPYKPVRIALFIMAVAWGVWAAIHWNSMQGLISGSVAGGLLVLGLIWQIHRIKKINAEDKDGDTLLFMAFIAGEKELASALIEKGASLDICVDGKSLKNDILEWLKPMTKKTVTQIPGYLD